MDEVGVWCCNVTRRKITIQVVTWRDIKDRSGLPDAFIPKPVIYLPPRDGFTLPRILKPLLVAGFTNWHGIRYIHFGFS